jgi:hypothetical protein
MEVRTGTMTGLNGFQLATERSLVSLLESRSLTLAASEVSGETEICLHARIAGTRIEIFLYEDGAGIYGPDLEWRFDLEEFEDLEALGEAFVVAAVECAERERAEP